jgi:hypothetical protein
MKTTPITFVSFCVDIDRGLLPMSNTIHRSFETYKRGINDSLITNVPLVLYTSIDDLRIPEHRNETNFRQYKLNKELIEKEFPNFELYQNSYHTTHRDEIANSLFYYTPLVVLKMKKMMEVIEDNPFNSDIFFWIDCFFTRGMIDTNFLYYEDDYLNMYQNVKSKLGDKFVLLDGNASRPFGFFWGGNQVALKNVYQNYFNIFFESLETKLLTEELIFKTISERYSDLMYLIQVEDLRNYKLTCQNFLIK